MNWTDSILATLKRGGSVRIDGQALVFEQPQDAPPDSLRGRVVLVAHRPSGIVRRRLSLQERMLIAVGEG